MTNPESPGQTDTPAIDSTLKEAIVYHQAGQLEDAGRLYLSILQTQPNHPEANHNLGVLAVQAEQAAAGLPYLVAALEANPAHGQYWLSYINALIHAGQWNLVREVLAMAQQQGLQGDEVDALATQLQEAEQRAVHPAQKSAPPKKFAQDNQKKTKGKAGKQNEPGPDEINTLLALFNAGSLTEAASLAQAMTVHYPQYGFGWKALGTVLQQMGRNADALAPLKKAAALLPNDAQVHNNLGITLNDLGRLEEAEECLRRALQIDANFADAHCNLGSALQDIGRFPEAETSFQRAIQLQPNSAIAHYNLGNLLKEQGRFGEAEASYRRALNIKPDYAQALSNLGVTLNDLARPAEAEVNLRRALEIKPDYAEAHSNLGNTLKELGRLGEAEISYRLALKLKPDLAEIHNNLGILLQDMGHLHDAETSYRKAIELKPDYDKAQSNLLFLLNYNPEISPAFAFEEARQYGQRITKKATFPFTKWPCATEHKRLRIGFVSGDFRNHPVGYFLENLLKNLDQTSLELIAYPTDYWTDELTLRIKPYFTAWKPLCGLNDEAAARLIHSDRVHILIDLSGHSRYNRLPVFAWKPAPVQVSWLGYFATTGVTEIDYLIADQVTLPESEENNFTETIWRLPETRLCFTPPEVDVNVSALPALTNGYITFGCFNNLAKMNDSVVALWSRVLASAPNSRLFLKSKQLGETSIRQLTIVRFAEHGIDADRLILEGAESRAKYLAAYHRVDIALDPFPYPGGTTTVECLWMGVPVLTLAGQSFLFRQGAGFLMNAELPEWIATSHDQYVARAVAHVAAMQELSELRKRLRQQMETSPIMDGKRFATYFAAALQAMWRERSAGKRT